MSSMFLFYSFKTRHLIRNVRGMQHYTNKQEVFWAIFMLNLTAF